MRAGPLSAGRWFSGVGVDPLCTRSIERLPVAIPLDSKLLASHSKAAMGRPFLVTT